jgi:hypothetical protein
MPQITKAARDAVRTRLMDATHGFNAAMAAVAPAYGVEAIALDFSATGRRFYEGFVHPDQVENSTSMRYPVAMLYGTIAQNRNLTKHAAFSGQVQVIFQVWLSWRKGNAIANTEDLVDAVEDALVRVFQDHAWAAAYTEPLAYNGELTVARAQLEQSGEHWRQGITARLTFEVDTADL